MKLKYDSDGNTLELHVWVLEDVKKQLRMLEIYILHFVGW